MYQDSLVSKYFASIGAHFSIVAFLLAICAISSCNENISILGDELEPKLALVGVLYQDLPLNIVLSKSYPFTEEAPDYRVPDALVVLLENGVPIDTLIPDLPDPNSQIATNLSGTRYYSKGAIHLLNGNAYTINAEVLGFPVLSTEALVFEPLAAEIDLIQADQLWETNGQLTTAVISGTIDHNYKSTGKWEVGVKYFFEGEEYADSISLRTSIPPFDEQFAKGGFIIENPDYGSHDFKFEYDYQAATQNRGEVIVALEFTFFDAEFLRFKEIIKRGRFEEFVGLQANIEPLPSNVLNGYGYFLLAERHRFIRIFP